MINVTSFKKLKRPQNIKLHVLDLLILFVFASRVTCLGGTAFTIPRGDGLHRYMGNMARSKIGEPVE